MTFCLIIDTSILGVSMALASLPGSGQAPSLLWQGQHAANTGSLEAIARLMRAGLAQQGIQSNEVGGLTVSVGPGSFTGIKVGLAFAYGLRSARSVPIPTLGTSGLGAAAEHRRAKSGAPQLSIFLPATRTHGFIGTATLQPDGTVAEDLHLVDAGGADSISPAAAPRAEQGGGNARALINALQSDCELVICGNWPLLEQLARATGRTPRIAEASGVSLDAIYGMAERSAQSWPNEFSAQLPLPRYMRLSTAEERLLAMKPKS